MTSANMAPLLIDGRRPVVFSDYDGTITERDVIMMIMEAFAPPEWKTIVHDILDARTLSIKDGVSQLFALLKSEQREEITAYVKANVQLRKGFENFLAFCADRQIPFNLVSGGADFFIDPIVEPFKTQIGLYYNVARFDAPEVRLDFPHYQADCAPCNQCACCKIGVMDQYPADEYFRIAIGDSLTDLGMARKADWVFARARLLDYTREAGIAVTPFESFDDIASALSKRLEVSVPC